MQIGSDIKMFRINSDVFNYTKNTYLFHMFALYLGHWLLRWSRCTYDVHDGRRYGYIDTFDMDILKNTCKISTHLHIGTHLVHVRKLTVTLGLAQGSDGDSGFLHQLQLASHNLDTIWQ